MSRLFIPKNNDSSIKSNAVYAKGGLFDLTLPWHGDIRSGVED